MKLLDIQMPSIQRMQYANMKSQEIWEPKINKSSQLYSKMEFDTVRHGVRDCMLLHRFSPYGLHEEMRNLAKDGLMLIPLSKDGSSHSGFGHKEQGYSGEGDFTYRALVARNMTDAETFLHAHYQSDEITMGQLLGFPECCCHFFDGVWKQGYFDPIWQQAESTHPDHIKNQKDFYDEFGNLSKRLIRIRPSEEAYKTLSVFRYVGARTISHFPCGFHCKASVEVADKWIDMARNIGLEGVDDVLDILRLPFEWDCLKGVAVINTPVFKIVTDSMPCYPNHVIQQESDFYPEEAPTGIKFPWQYFR